MILAYICGGNVFCYEDSVWHAFKQKFPLALQLKFVNHASLTLQSAPHTPVIHNVGTIITGEAPALLWMRLGAGQQPCLPPLKQQSKETASPQFLANRLVTNVHTQDSHSTDQMNQDLQTSHTDKITCTCNQSNLTYINHFPVSILLKCHKVTTCNNEKTRRIRFWNRNTLATWFP